MPVSPNDPDYQDVFAQFRERIEAQRVKKTTRTLYTPPGCSNPSEVHKEQARERARQKRQKEKEARNAD